VYACVLIVCYRFSGDRIERWVCRGRRGLRVKGRREPGIRQRRQAIYSWCISAPIHPLACFLTSLSKCMFFLYYYSPCSNYCWLSSTSQIVIIHSDDTFEHLLRWIDGRLCSIIRTPHTCVWRSVVVSRRIYRILWVKCTTSVEGKSIRIASPRSWTVGKITTLPNVRFWFYKVFSEKWRKVPDEVLGGYCRGTGMVRSTCRVLPRNWRWSCAIDLVLWMEVVIFDWPSIFFMENKWVPPSLESLHKSVFKNVFQQRYIDAVGHAISTRENMLE
jgi:hypothetical protein